MWMIEYRRYDAACGEQGSVDEIPASECSHVPFLNGWWTMCWDYLWLVCLFVTPYFLPHNPVFIVRLHPLSRTRWRALRKVCNACPRTGLVLT
jgi:hypothetical protein